VKVLAQTKSNLASEASSLEYRISPWSEDPEIPRIRWLGVSALSADDLLRQHDSRRDDYAQREASDFWKEVLGSNTRRMTAITAEALEAGISPTTLRRAPSASTSTSIETVDARGRTVGWFAHLAEYPRPGVCDRCRPR